MLLDNLWPRLLFETPDGGSGGGGAAPAVAEPAAGGEGGAAPAAAPEAGAGGEGGPDIGRLAEHVETLSEQLGPVLEYMQGQQGAGQPGAQPGEAVAYDPTTGLYYDAQGQQVAAPTADPPGAQPGVPGAMSELEGLYGGDLSDPQQLAQALGQHAQQQDARTQAMLGPVMQELQELRIDRTAGELEAQYPDLQGEKAEATWTEATRLAAEAGHPDLVLNKSFIEAVYLAGQARERAAGEQLAGAQPAPSLEASGGAGVPPGGEADPAESVVNAGRGPRGNSIFGI